MASDKSSTTTTNTPSWSTPPPTAATTALQADVAGGPDYTVGIRNAYGRAEQNLSKSYSNPLGAYTTADVKDKAMRSQMSDLNQNEGLDLSNAAQQNAQGTFNRQATVAGLTAPQMYNASSKATTPWSLGDTLGLASSTGGAALGAS